MEGNFEFLVKLILNNTRLNYDKNDLRIDNDTVLLEVIKVLNKQLYDERFQELIEKENKED